MKSKDLTMGSWAPAMLAYLFNVFFFILCRKLSAVATFSKSQVAHENADLFL